MVRTPRITFETVDFDTPARLATSRIVGGLAAGDSLSIQTPPFIGPILRAKLSGRATMRRHNDLHGGVGLRQLDRLPCPFQRHTVANDAIEGQAAEIRGHE